MIGDGVTIQEPLDSGKITVELQLEGKKMNQYIATGVAVLPALQVGIVLGWTSTALPYLTSKESSITVSETEGAWVTSLASIGALFGAIPAGKIADKIGRKRSMFILNLFYLISWIMFTLSKNVWNVYAGRISGGIGAGGTCVLSLMYVGEIAETSVRGRLASTFAILLSFGLLYTYGLGAILSYRIFGISGIVLSLIFFVLSPLLTESPIWLMQQNRKPEAKRALEKLRGSAYDVGNEISLIQSQITEQKKLKSGGLKDIVKTRAGRKAIIAGLGLMIFQQLSGIDAVLSYTVTIFKSAGSTIEPYLATTIVGAVQVVMAIIVSIIIEKVGRKPLLIFSGTSLTICLLIIGYYFKIKNSGSDVTGIGWIPLASLGVYIAVHPVGFGSIPWTMVSELFPPETKGVASSISMGLNWSLVFIVTQFFPTMVKRLGEPITFWIFAVIMIIATFFAIFLVPETKGKSLEQIQKKLGKKKVDKFSQIIDRSQGDAV